MEKDEGCAFSRTVTTSRQSFCYQNAAKKSKVQKHLTKRIQEVEEKKKKEETEKEETEEEEEKLANRRRLFGDDAYKKGMGKWRRKMEVGEEEE